jgi:acylphosphatase
MHVSHATHQEESSTSPLDHPPQIDAEVRKTIHFSGRVQGVGFRYTARNIAQQYKVRGYVRNLADGRVELVMEGTEKETSDVVEALKRKMAGFVRNVNVQTDPPVGEFEDFGIRH